MILLPPHVPAPSEAEIAEQREALAILRALADAGAIEAALAFSRTSLRLVETRDGARRMTADEAAVADARCARMRQAYRAGRPLLVVVDGGPR
jgi:hypothetical protein